MGQSDQIEFFAATDVGRKRKHNEDNFLVDKDLGLYVVADGMGGHAAGEVASAMAVRVVHEVISGNRDLVTGATVDDGPRSERSAKQVLGLLEYAVHAASQRIHGEAQTDSKKRGMGTTLSLLLLAGSHAYVAHVGDSRVYMVRGGVVNRVTEDHTVANELLRLGMVAPDQVHKVPRKNAITRAVGVYQHVEVDTLTLEVLPNDQFLLCSDGLCGYLDEAEADLCHMLAGLSGDEAVKSLIDFANEQGGRDNITAVLLCVGGDEQADSGRVRRVTLKRDVMAAMPLFSRLNERELLRLMQVAYVRLYEAGEQVVQEGEPGYEMFVILAGRLQVSTGDAALRELTPGEHFGEMALIRSTPRSATVTATDPSELIALGRDDFFDIIRSEPLIAVKLLWQFMGVLANRLERTSADLRQAREQGGSPQAAEWIDDEPSLDPFAHGTPSPRLTIALSQPLPVIHVAEEEEDDGRPGNTPTFDDAPALAERLSPPPGEVPPVPSEVPEPSTERRVRDALTRMGISDGDEVDAKATQPGHRAAAEKRVQIDPKLAQRAKRSQKFSDTMPSVAGVRVGSKRTRVTEDEDAAAPLDSGEVQTPRGTPPTETADAEGAAADGQPDVRATEPRPAGARGPEFRPTKVTIPLNPDDSLRDELDALRKEFKARLAESRKERERKDSD